MSCSEPDACAAARLPLAEVRPHNGAPALFIEGRPIFALMLMTGPHALAQMKQLGDCPIHLLTDTFPLGWLGIGRYDYNEFDEKMRQFLAVDPGALIMPRILLDAPEDWMSAWPDDVVGYADPAGYEDKGSWGGARHPSWASRRWRGDAAEALRRLVRHAVAADYAPHLIGWHVGSGIYGEWHAWNAVYYPDTSPAFVAAYREWLAKRHPERTPEPRLPTLEERRRADVGLFREPAKWQWFLDHAEFFHALGAETLAEFARIAKEETAGRSFVLAFNGYLPDLGVNQEIDHRAFDRTLRCADVDAFASPHSYWRRGPGQDAMMRGFLGTVRAHGRLWFDEQDDRTSLAHESQYKHVKTMEETIEVLWRGFAQALTHNCGLWFMDQGGLWFMSQEGAWYRHERIVRAFAEMQRVAEQSMRRPRTRASEVAVVSSLRTAFYIADRSGGLDNVTHVLIEPQLAQLARCGVPFDLHLISELVEPTVPEYRAYVFLDTFFMTDDELAKVVALKQAGKTLLFFYAPGFVSEGELSLQRMRELLGLPVEMAESITLPNGAVQQPGFVVPGASGRMSRAGNVHYCAAPPLSASELRELFREAGVHVYLDSDDPLLVGGGYLAVHAAADGEKLLQSPSPVDWLDVRTGQRLARATDRLSVRLSRGQTLLLSLE